MIWLASISRRWFPVSKGGSSDPALAQLVRGLVPVWERRTGRAVGLFSSYKEGMEEKRCLFADWLCEMHALLGGWLGPPGLERHQYSPMGIAK